MLKRITNLLLRRKYFEWATFGFRLAVAAFAGHCLVHSKAALANPVIIADEVAASGSMNVEESILYLPFPIVLDSGNPNAQKGGNVNLSVRNWVDSSIEFSTISSEKWSQVVVSDLADHSFDPHSEDWRLTIWGGIAILADLSEILTFNDIELADAYIIGLAANRPILTLNHRVALEGELQALKHFGDQNHLEFTGGVGIRWQVADPVSVAFFNGLSLATEIPKIEEQRADKTNSLLNYFALEIEVNIDDNWAVTGRLHHRSGAFGLFNGVRRGSNVYLFGVSHTL